jgi:hypothetical protein
MLDSIQGVIVTGVTILAVVAGVGVTAVIVFVIAARRSQLRGS